MLFSPKHDGRPVRTPLVLKMAEATPEEALADLRQLRASKATRVALEDFVRRHMALRDALAWKAARGALLSVKERATLHAFEHILDELEGPPQALPPDVEAILRDLDIR